MRLTDVKGEGKFCDSVAGLSRRNHMASPNSVSGRMGIANPLEFLVCFASHCAAVADSPQVED